MTFDGIIEALGGRLGVEIENAGGAAAVEIDGAVVVLQDAAEMSASDDLAAQANVMERRFKPLTRAERANNVRKRGYLHQFSDAAQQVLEALLDKYATAQIRDLDDIKILQLAEFKKIGSPSQIVKIFGGREQYLKAAQALENELYREAA